MFYVFACIVKVIIWNIWNLTRNSEGMVLEGRQKEATSAVKTARDYRRTIILRYLFGLDWEGRLKKETVWKE